MSFPLYSLPREILDLILTFAHPTDVARVSQTCRQLRDVIYRADQYLWRTLYLCYPFDHPTLSSYFSKQGVSAFNWKEELQRRVSAELYLSSYQQPTSKLDDAFETLIHVIATAADYSSTAGESHNLSWVSRILGACSVLTDNSLDGRSRSLRAQLRAYLALSYDETPVEQSDALRALRLQSRCYVYALPNYSELNRFGPYIINEEGLLQPNWEHVGHIVNVVIFNLRDRANQDAMVETMFDAGPSTSTSVDNDLCPKWNLQMTRAYSAPRSFERKPHDWAGAEGIWRRLVSLMDYRELFTFNYSSLGEIPRDPKYWDKEGISEGLRDIEMHLSLVDNADIVPEPFDDPSYPPLMYKGIARARTGPGGPEVDIKGVVRRYLNGTIRWTYLTFYEGTRQWSAEGVQLGHVCSAAGVAGIWTGAEHYVGDPVGPFLMYKVADALRPIKN